MLDAHYFKKLAVTFAHHEIKRAEDGYNIRDELVFADMGQNREVTE